MQKRHGVIATAFFVGQPRVVIGQRTGATGCTHPVRGAVASVEQPRGDWRSCDRRRELASSMQEHRVEIRSSPSPTIENPYDVQARIPTIPRSPPADRAGDCQPLSLIHISEPTRLLSISYAVFCLKK